MEVDHPQLIEEVITELPVRTDAAFTLCARPDLRQKYLAADRLELPGGESARVGQGTVYQCHHGDQLYVFEIVDWCLGEYLTGRYTLPMGLSILETTEFTPIGSGTRLRVRISKPQGGTAVGKLMKPVVARKLATVFRNGYEGHTQRIRNITAQYRESFPDDDCAGEFAISDLESMVGSSFATA